MSFKELVTTTTQYFPELKVKYKNQSWLMRTLGNILFFNPDFMTKSVTTVCNSIYFPNPHFTALHPVTSSVMLVHEVVHVKRTKQLAHLSTLYYINALGKKLHFDPKLEEQVKQFHDINLDKTFNKALVKIKRNQRPFEDTIFDILDVLVTKL